MNLREYLDYKHAPLPLWHMRQCAAGCCGAGTVCCDARVDMVKLRYYGGRSDIYLFTSASIPLPTCHVRHCLHHYIHLTYVYIMY